SRSRSSTTSISCPKGTSSGKVRRPRCARRAIRTFASSSTASRTGRYRSTIRHERSTRNSPVPSDTIAWALRRVGAGTLDSIARLGFAARFSIAVLTHMPAAFRRLRLTLREIYFSGVLSLVIILVSGLFVGMVLALQGYEVLTRYGANESLGILVALS